MNESIARIFGLVGPAPEPICRINDVRVYPKPGDAPNVWHVVTDRFDRHTFTIPRPPRIRHRFGCVEVAIEWLT